MHNWKWSSQERDEAIYIRENHVIYWWIILSSKSMYIHPKKNDIILSFSSNYLAMKMISPTERWRIYSWTTPPKKLLLFQQIIANKKHLHIITWSFVTL